MQKSPICVIAKYKPRNNGYSDHIYPFNVGIGPDNRHAKKMTDFEEKFKAFSIALRMVGANLAPYYLDLLFKVTTALNEKGEELTVRELCAIEAEVEASHKPKQEDQ